MAVSHESINTNAFKAKTGLSKSGICPLECNCEESVLRTLRGCKRAKEVWSTLIDPNHRNSFFSCDFQEWLRKNSTVKLGRRGTNRWAWHKVFGYRCWLISKARCIETFESRVISLKEVVQQSVFHLYEEANECIYEHQIFKGDDTQRNRWIPPPPDFIRIDVDASVRDHGQAACGGVVRDASGNWVVGFQKKLGVMPVTIAEILAIKTGLPICKRCSWIH